MAEENEDWLFPDAKQQKADRQEFDLLWAQKYLVFGGPTSDPRARELLASWTQAARNRRIRIGASAQEFAHYNAFREFVEKIHALIEFAQKGQNVPQPRTTK